MSTGNTKEEQLSILKCKETFKDVANPNWMLFKKIKGSDSVNYYLPRKKVLEVYKVVQVTSTKYSKNPDNFIIT